MGTIIIPTKTDTTKTTCIEISAETFKCIDISAYVPTCIMITSNVPTSEQYEKPRYDDVEITEAPELQIALINNEAPILNVNMDEDGIYYVTDFDTVYIDITNWNTNAEYVNIFSNQDGNDAVIYLDEENQRIIWALDDYALDGIQMWLYAQAKEGTKLISPQSNITVMQMIETTTPILSGVYEATEGSVQNIIIENYNMNYTYSDAIVTGGTAIRTDNIIEWTLPYVSGNVNHQISITANAPVSKISQDGIHQILVNGTCEPVFDAPYIVSSSGITATVSLTDMTAIYDDGYTYTMFSYPYFASIRQRLDGTDIAASEFSVHYEWTHDGDYDYYISDTDFYIEIRRDRTCNTAYAPYQRHYRLSDYSIRTKSCTIIASIYSNDIIFNGVTISPYKIL